jgi:predicted CXXCH cytochrome family protein
MWAQKIVGTEDLLSNMCKSCHSETGAAGKKPIGHNSHPVNKTLKRIGSQSTLPLFNTEGKRLTTAEDRVEGKVFCATCHDVHQWNAQNPKIGSGANEEGDATNSFLRIQASPKPDLCANCHKGKTYVFKTDHDLRVTAPEATTAAGKNVAQTGVCGACHMVHNSPVKAKLWARNISGKGDIIAQLCTSCHTKGGPAEKKLTGRYTHPTGKPVSNINIKILEDGRWTHPYLDALPAKDRPKLTPLPFFDSEGNRVADGNVSCGSCHNPHQWDPNSPKPGKNKNIEGDGTNSFLRIAHDPNSALCKNCHVEKRTVAFSKHNLKLMAPGEKNIEGRTAKKTGICSTCHLPHNGRGPKMWARKPDRSGDMVERLCKSCHKKGEVAERKLTGAHSHPLGKSVKLLGIIPSSRTKWKAPNNALTQGTKEDTIFPLPLYKQNGERTVDGNITCGSCHDPHQWVPGEFEKDALSIKSETFKSALKNFTKKLKSIKKEEGDGRSSFLRMPNAPDSGLCKNCHIDKRSVELSKHNLNIFAKDEKNVQNLSPQESGSCSACHLPHNGTSLKMWARKLPDTKEDKISNLCKSCHSEGQIAEQKSIRDYSHPVFADIDKVGGKTDLPLYSKAGRKTGKKYGGKVVCSTCHDPHRWDPNDIASKAGASKKVEGDATNSFLRIAAYPSPMLCINCHEDKKYVEFTDHDLSITAPDAKNLQGYTVKEAGKCGMCHMIHNSPNPVRLWAMEKGPGDDEMERLCRSCHLEGRIAGHKRPRYFNHPPDVKATSNIVRAKKLKSRGKRKQKKSQEVVTGEKIKPMPVYKITGEKVTAGLITCPSCHDPHNWSAIEKGYGPGKKTEGDNTNSFLRSMSNMAICSDCHGFDGIFRYKYYHGPSSRDKNVPMRGIRRGIE